MYCPWAKLPPLVLRQPPPPIRALNGASTIEETMGTHFNTDPTLSKTEEENNTERGNCSNVSGQTRPSYFRRCKGKILKSTTNIESLPVELVFEILVRVPAQDIYDATQLVCRKWYKIIHTRDFIHSHLQQSTRGLLAWNMSTKRDHIDFISSGKDLFEKSKVNYELKVDLMSSCDGLVLASHNECYDVYIRNPATKQNFALPPFLSSTKPCGFAIAYAATSMVYKVVCAFLPFDHRLQDHIYDPEGDCVEILTVGVDKEWAGRVDTKHLSFSAKNLLLSHPPFTTEGFVHWVENNTYSEYVLTLNVETEIFTQFPIPSSLSCADGKNKVKYLPMGSYISLLILRSEFSWEFWEMKPETGEWTKLPSIDLEAQFADARNYVLRPVGWSRPREVLVFSVCKGPSRSSTRLCFVFNVRTRELQEYKLDAEINQVIVHRNSLLWMDG